MSKLIEYALANPLIGILGVLVVVLLVHFVVQYVWRGLDLRTRLREAVGRVRALDARGPETVKSRLSEALRDTRLERAGREFEESLHEQRIESGPDAQIVAIRATQPAENFFNLETVVDPWIGSEYFRHLPGILTGFGIIGTFFGLIQGLVHFDPSLADSAGLKRGLGELFGHVRDAFIFSGTAIAAAILVTITEKWLYSSCAKWVFELASALDGIFKTGVGEEYLSSLLRASQDNASQSRRFQEVVTHEFKSLLTDLSDRQVQATQQLSLDLSRSIRQSLQEPLADIARTVALTKSRDSDSVRHLLEQLMTSFQEQMRQTMGQQLSDLSGLIEKTADSVYQVEFAMHRLLADVQQSGRESANSMQSAVRELMEGVSRTQESQGDAITSAAKGVLLQLNEAVVRIAAAQEEVARNARAGNEATAADMRRHVADVATSHLSTIGATRELLDRFEGLSGAMVEKLAAGTGAVVTAVRSLHQAAEQMSRVGSEMAELEGQAQRSSRDMVRASSHLAAAAKNVGNSITQLGNAAIRFEGVATSASVEANARRQLLIGLQDVVDQSQVASREFVNLAQEARKALDTSVEHFETDVSSILAGHVKAYQKQLGDSVSVLRHALDQLAKRAVAHREGP